MDALKSMKPGEVIVLGILIALSICDDFGPNELNVLGNLISTIGSVISTCAAQQQLLESSYIGNPSLQEMEKQIRSLQKVCEELSGGGTFSSNR